VFTKSHGVVRAEEDAEKSKQVLIWCRQLFNKLRKIKDKESDHGRHMKGFNKLKVREPMSQVVENDADTVSQRKDDDNLDEVGLFNIFVRGLLFMLSLLFYMHLVTIHSFISSNVSLMYSCEFINIDL